MEAIEDGGEGGVIYSVIHQAKTEPQLCASTVLGGQALSWEETMNRKHHSGPGPREIAGVGPLQEEHGLLEFDSQLCLSLHTGHLSHSFLIGKMGLKACP